MKIKPKYKLTAKQAEKVNELLNYQKEAQKQLNLYLQAAADFLEVPEGYIYNTDKQIFEKQKNESNSNIQD